MNYQKKKIKVLNVQNLKKRLSKIKLLQKQIKDNLKYKMILVVEIDFFFFHKLNNYFNYSQLSYINGLIAGTANIGTSKFKNP